MRIDMHTFTFLPDPRNQHRVEANQPLQTLRW